MIPIGAGAFLSGEPTRWPTSTSPGFSGIRVPIFRGNRRPVSYTHLYLIRLLGGALFLSGVLVMAWNVWKTVRGAQAVNPAIPQDDPHATRAPAVAAPAPATV